MNLDLEDTVICYWCVDFQIGNWHATLVRRKGSDHYELETRLRMYVDDETGPDSDDYKRFHEEEFGEDKLRAKVLATDYAMKALVHLTHGTFTKKEFNAPASTFIDWLLKQPHIHATSVAKVKA